MIIKIGKQFAYHNWGIFKTLNKQILLYLLERGNKRFFIGVFLNVQN